MRGTDVTPAQLKSAENFIRARQACGRSPQSDELISIRFDHLCRLVAWYGALRYAAGRDGIATLEEPGYFVVSRK